MPIPRIAALAAAAAAVALLAGCGGTPPAGPYSGSTPSAAVSPTASPGPAASGSPTPTPEPPVVPASMRENIVDAVSSGNTAALDGYLAPSVHITYCASEYEGDVTDHDLVIYDISQETSPSATWDFDLPTSVVTGYHDSSPSYYDDFPPGAIVGLSSENKVLSFAIAGELITRVFICVDAAALS